MRILVLWADELSANLGVRALATGTASLVRRVWPDAEVEYQNFGSRNPHLPLGKLTSILKERVSGRRGMQRWLGSFDLVLDTRSGDSFADIYGLRRLRIMSAVAEFASQAGTRVVLGPQTIGPFTTRQGVMLGRLALRRSVLSMARDGESFAYAGSLRTPADLLTTDVVFALPVPAVTANRDVVLNVSGLLWQPGAHVDSRHYRAVVTDVYRRLVAEGRTVSLLAHVLDSPTPDNDVPALEEFARTLNDDPEMLVPASLGQAREYVASANLVIGSRMHACLNALSVGTPAIPLAYSRKFRPLLHDLGWEHTIDLRSAEDPATDVLTASAFLHNGLGGTDVRKRADELLLVAEDALRTLT